MRVKFTERKEKDDKNTKKVSFLESLISVDRNAINKLYKIASFYNKKEEALNLIMSRLVFGFQNNKRILLIQIDSENSTTFDLFLRRQEKLFLKRNKNNIPHKLSILENILDLEQAKNIHLLNESETRKNRNKCIIDFHGHYME